MESQTIQELEALTPVEMDAGLVFSGVPTGNKIWGYQNPCLYTPAIDPHYSFHESARDAAVWFMNKLDPLYLYGPTGSGKTSLIKQLAARLNYPIFEVTGHARLEFADLCGHMKSNDEILMSKVMKTINDHLADPTLNVEMLAANVGMSRVHMHRKLKELTNQSARDFIRSIRLKQAANLLREKNLSVSEVAYATGFSNLSHFSNTFRDFYGISPSEYKEQQM